MVQPLLPDPPQLRERQRYRYAVWSATGPLHASSRIEHSASSRDADSDDSECQDTKRHGSSTFHRDARLPSGLRELGNPGSDLGWKIGVAGISNVRVESGAVSAWGCEYMVEQCL